MVLIRRTVVQAGMILAVIALQSLQAQGAFRYDLAQLPGRSLPIEVPTCTFDEEMDLIQAKLVCVGVNCTQKYLGTRNAFNATVTFRSCCNVGPAWQTANFTMPFTRMIASQLRFCTTPAAAASPAPNGTVTQQMTEEPASNCTFPHAKVLCEPDQPCFCLCEDGYFWDTSTKQCLSNRGNSGSCSDCSGGSGLDWNGLGMVIGFGCLGVLSCMSLCCVLRSKKQRRRCARNCCKRRCGSKRSKSSSPSHRERRGKSSPRKRSKRSRSRSDSSSSSDSTSSHSHSEHDEDSNTDAIQPPPRIPRLSERLSAVVTEAVSRSSLQRLRPQPPTNTIPTATAAARARAMPPPAPTHVVNLEDPNVRLSPPRQPAPLRLTPVPPPPPPTTITRPLPAQMQQPPQGQNAGAVATAAATGTSTRAGQVAAQIAAWKAKAAAQQGKK